MMQHEFSMDPIIRAYVTESTAQMEDDCPKVCQSYGFDVDKERLQQALTDARKFYDEGYEAGKRAAEKDTRELVNLALELDTKLRQLVHLRAEVRENTSSFRWSQMNADLIDRRVKRILAEKMAVGILDQIEVSSIEDRERHEWVWSIDVYLLVREDRQDNSRCD